MEKEINIVVPEGYEIDKENSTFECIKFKPIQSKKRWIDLFKCEMTYRKIKEERKTIQENLSKYEEIGELCL